MLLRFSLLCMAPLLAACCSPTYTLVPDQSPHINPPYPLDYNRPSYRVLRYTPILLGRAARFARVAPP